MKRTNSLVQNVSGMIIYNLTQTLLLQIKFDTAFTASIFDMPNDSFIYVLNNKNQIEGWNLANQQLVQKGITSFFKVLADCRPSTITSIKFQKELPNMLFTMGHGEWLVRNFRLGLIQKRKLDRTNLKKVEFLDDCTCVVLHGKKILELWDFFDNKVTQLKVDFELNDFFVYRKN